MTEKSTTTGSVDGDVEQWFAVRCVFDSRYVAVLNDVDSDERLYEERITLWRAESAEAAIALAEREARDYAGDFDVYLGLAQSYRLEIPPGHGAEVFSLLRASALEPEAYLTSFFDTGAEEQDHIGADERQQDA